MEQHASAPVQFDVADPFGFYARLREEGPVHSAITPDGAPVWLATRYDDVRAALADPDLSVDKAHSQRGYSGFSLPPALDANLLNMDGPDHARLRRMVAKAFTPARVEMLRPRVHDLANALVDELPQHGPADLIAPFAGPLPIAVICELLGVDDAHRPDFRAWTDQLLAPDPANPQGARDALLALHGFLLDLVAAKRSDPGEDMLSTLITLRDSHDQLSEDELTSAAFLVLFAGYENTVHLLGNGLAALLSQPELWASLRADNALLSTAVDELLRFDPPPQLSIRRFALRDLELGGVRIPAGDTVMLSLASANRDPDRFAEADRVDLARADNPHVGFGHGRHFCLGASLARMEAEVGLATLLNRLPDLSLAVGTDDLRWRPSFRNRGLRELPVEFTRDRDAVT